MQSLSPVEQVQRWVEGVVVGLGLCPFAAAPFRSGRLRLVQSEAADEMEILAELVEELTLLDSATGSIDSSLLVIPHLLWDFDDFLDLIAAAEDLLQKLDYDGHYQLAHFHPDYCFADAPVDDPANYTNRSPFPVLHILRWADVRAAIDDYPDVEMIPARNQELLRAMGSTAIQACWHAAVTDGQGSNDAN